MKKSILFVLAVSFLMLASCSQDGSQTCAPCELQSQPQSESESQSESQPELVEIKESVCLLPNDSHLLDLGKADGPISVAIDQEEIADVVVKGGSQVSIVALQEGEATVTVLTETSKYVVSVECIDLAILNEQSHIEKGGTLQIVLSKNVVVSYEIEGTGIATVSETGLIEAREEGVFTLKVKYKDIVVSKTFDTYARKNEIAVFNRDNPFVHYLGRNFHENQKVRLDNEGSGFEVCFEGTSLKAVMAGMSSSWYGFTMVSVLLDDEIDTTKRVITLNHSSKEAEYTLVENLTPGLHRVRLLKRTENLSTYLTLSKLVTDGAFHVVGAGRKLKMEVYGDSITAGYGNLRGSLSDQTSAIYQSGLQTYASYAALELGAELNIQARSGIGIYTANNDIGEGNHVKDHYDKVNYDGEHHWNFDNYTPDIVLINLGTNDYWDPRFNEQTFKTNYVNFVSALANEYGKETSFVLLSGLMEQQVDGFLSGIKATLEASLPNAFYQYQFSQCNNGHPLYGEHAKASDELIRLIKANHLDALPQREESETIIPEAGSETIAATIEAELQDEIKTGSELYINLPGGAKAKATKIDAFHYRFALPSMAEGDVEAYFTIDDNEEYKSADYLVHVRKDFTDKLVLDTFLSSPITEDQGVSGWTVTNHLFEEEVSIVDESNLTVTNSNWLAGMVVRDSLEGDDLRISARITFGDEISDYTQAFAGLVPYYLDDNNFVVAYLQWSADGNIRGIGCTGIIEGSDIGWNDFFSIVGFPTNPTAGIDFALTRNGTALTVECGGMTETKNIAGMTGDTEKVGVWNICAGNPVTYSGFTETHQEKTSESNWQFTSHLFDGSMTVNPDSSVTLTNSGNWMAGFA
ncbi:MAG: pilus assembly protein N-terminal domain-containing protein, partial [Bacilli bacterium]|nr:pilus assembly protein N-terminal domain-containing protein [Bacilli bacterium]